MNPDEKMKNMFARLGLAGATRNSEFQDGYWYVTVTPPRWSGFEKSSTVKLDEDQHERYLMWLRDGGLIQHMLPELSPAIREQLLSGICPEDWDTLRDPEENTDVL